MSRLPSGRRQAGPRSPGGSGEGGRRVFAVLAAAVVVATVPVALSVVRDRDGAAGARAGIGGFDGPPPPVYRASDGSAVVVWGDEGAPVLEIFTDYRCSACKAMEDAVGPLIKRLASQGRIRVVYRPIELPWGGGGGGPSGPRPTQGSPTASVGSAVPAAADRSPGAANAALCAPARNWYPYHDALFAHQPRQGAPDLGAAELIAIGGRAGITGRDFAACVSGRARAELVGRMTRYAIDTRGVRKVPAAFLNGEPLDLDAHLGDPAALERKIHAARG